MFSPLDWLCLSPCSLLDSAVFNTSQESDVLMHFYFKTGCFHLWSNKEWHDWGDTRFRRWLTPLQNSFETYSSMTWNVRCDSRAGIKPLELCFDGFSNIPVSWLEWLSAQAWAPRWERCMHALSGTALALAAGEYLENKLKWICKLTLIKFLFWKNIMAPQSPVGCVLCCWPALLTASLALGAGSKYSC